jgi:hypothetical protein
MKKLLCLTLLFVGCGDGFENAPLGPGTNLTELHCLVETIGDAPGDVSGWPEPVPGQCTRLDAITDGGYVRFKGEACGAWTKCLTFDWTERAENGKLRTSTEYATVKTTRTCCDALPPCSVPFETEGWDWKQDLTCED